MKRRQYSSPRHKLISFFHVGRNRWRERAKTYQEEIRSLKVRVRDVEASRDHWRAKYYQSQSGAGAEAVEPPARDEPPLSGPGRRGVRGGGVRPW
jgi:hypothetical protein